MGVDFKPVCRCGSYHSDYILSTKVRTCRDCEGILSIDGVHTELSPVFGMTKEQSINYFRRPTPAPPIGKKEAYRILSENRIKFITHKAHELFPMFQIGLNEGIENVIERVIPELEKLVKEIDNV